MGDVKDYMAVAIQAKAEATVLSDALRTVATVAAPEPEPEPEPEPVTPE